MSDSSNKPALRATGDEETVLQEISILLRDGRLDAGESVEDVADSLRINRRYLEALEEGRFDELPGPVYTLGFIRSFGDHVGLDGEELVRRFKSASSSSDKRAELDFPEPIPESGLPGGAVLFAGIVVAGLAYGGWYLLSEDDSLLSDLVAPVPEQLAQKADEQPAVSDDPLVVIEQEPAVVIEQTEQVVEDAAEAADAAAEDVAQAVEQATEEVETAALDVVDSASETADAAGETLEEMVTEAAETAEEAVEAVVEETEQTVAVVEETANEAVDEATSVIEPAHEPHDEPSAALDDEQMGAMQTGMIDAPIPEPTGDVSAPAEDAVAEAASEPEPEPEPEPELDSEPEPESEPAAASVEEADDEPVETAAQATGEDDVQETAALTVEAESESAPDEPVAESEPAIDEDIVRVVIRAQENSWVEISDADTGEILFSRLMRVGDRYGVPNRPGLQLQTGNAGALLISVDGESVAPIGHSGEVSRGVSLDPDDLQAR